MAFSGTSFPFCTFNVYGGGMSSFRTCPTPTGWREQDGIDYYYSGTDEEFEEYFIFVRQMVLEDYILQFPDTACFLTVRLQSEGPLSTTLQCSHHTTSNEEIFPAFMQTLDDAVAKKVKCLEEMQNGLLDGTRDLSYGT
jgi:hypothetical protein